MTDLEDPYLPERIRRALIEAEGVGEIDVQVVVAAGRVTLTGNVSDQRRSERVTALVRQLVPGHDVCNEIDVMRLGAPDSAEHLH